MIHSQTQRQQHFESTESEMSSEHFSDPCIEEVEDSGSDVEEDEFMEQYDCCGAAEFQAASYGNQSGSTNSSNQQCSPLLGSKSKKALRA